MGLLSKAEEKKRMDSLSSSVDGSFDKPSLLKKAEEIRNSPDFFLDDHISEEEDETLPAVLEEEKDDLFDSWEKEAKANSQTTPLKSEEDDEIKKDEDYLFDDESDFTTAPIEYHLASKKRIENFNAIFEIAKEIASAREVQPFLDNLVYSLTGQLGCNSLVVVSNLEGDFTKLEVVAKEGIELPSAPRISETDFLYKYAYSHDSVNYCRDLLNSELSSEEREFVLGSQAEIIAPIRHRDEFCGFLLVGSLISGEEYVAEDLELLKVLGEISGSVMSRVIEFEKKVAEVETLQESLNVRDSVQKFGREIALARKIDDAYDTLVETLKERLGVESFSFFVLDMEKKENYQIFSSNLLTAEAMDSVRLSKNSNIVGMVSNVMGIYRVEDFRSHVELTSIFRNDELAIMKEFVILPLINLNWLVGLFVIHETKFEWDDISREIAVNLMESASPVFSNVMMIKDRESVFHNPFSPVEDRLGREIEKADNLSTKFTVSVFKIQNVTRMITVLGSAFFAQYCENLRRSIMEHIGETDYYARVGQGKFLLILHGKGKEESDIVIRKVKAFFDKEDKDSRGFKTSFRIHTLNYPDDTNDKESILEMIDET